MSKPGRTLKKANHGKRPANAKARKAKRHAVKTGDLPPSFWEGEPFIKEE